MLVSSPNAGHYSWQDPKVQAALHQGNVNGDDAVERAHLYDVPQVGAIDGQVVPGLYFDSSQNIGGVGNSIVEVFTLPGVVLQRVTGIDSGKIATRRQYGGQWSTWLVVAPS